MNTVEVSKSDKVSIMLIGNNEKDILSLMEKLNIKNIIPANLVGNNDSEMLYDGLKTITEEMSQELPNLGVIINGEFMSANWSDPHLVNVHLMYDVTISIKDNKIKLLYKSGQCYSDIKIRKVTDLIHINEYVRNIGPLFQKVKCE
jgi:hypothetical protein